jgi:hypothetical protein
VKTIIRDRSESLAVQAVLGESGRVGTQIVWRQLEPAAGRLRFKDDAIIQKFMPALSFFGGATEAIEQLQGIF